MSCIDLPHFFCIASVEQFTVIYYHTPQYNLETRLFLSDTFPKWVRQGVPGIIWPLAFDTVLLDLLLWDYVKYVTYVTSLPFSIEEFRESGKL